VHAVADLRAGGPRAAGAGAREARVARGDAEWIGRRDTTGRAHHGTRGAHARSAAAVTGRRATRAHRRAGVATRVPAGRIGQAQTSAALLCHDTGIAGSGAPHPTRQAAHRPGGIGAAGRACTALVGLHAQLADDPAMIRGPARRLRASTDALGPDVANTGTASRVGRAALLLGLAAGRANTSGRAVRRGRTPARATIVVVRAKGERGPATGQRLTAHDTTGRGGTAPAATDVARRADFAVDPTPGQKLAGHDAAFAPIGAAPSAAVVSLPAGFAGGPAVRDRRAPVSHAHPAAAVLRNGAGAAGGDAARGGAHAARATERTAGSGVRATLFARRATGRVGADVCSRPGWIRRAHERAAVGARDACRAFRPTDGRLAAPARASSRTALGASRTPAPVRRAVHDRRRARNRELDVAPAGAHQRRQRQRNRDPAFQGRAPSPASRRAAAAASPRGNSSR
jgi:hypothetical protein